jgi:hypothetical protein
MHVYCHVGLVVGHLVTTIPCSFAAKFLGLIVHKDSKLSTSIDGASNHDRAVQHGTYSANVKS